MTQNLFSVIKVDTTPLNVMIMVNLRLGLTLLILP